MNNYPPSQAEAWLGGESLEKVKDSKGLELS
jgi:hypothetical protein